MAILVASFFEADCQKRGLNFSWGRCDLHRNYGMVIILLSFLCNYDNLILKLYQEKRSYLMKDGFLLKNSKLEVCQECWSVALVASEKGIKIHHEYDGFCH